MVKLIAGLIGLIGLATTQCRVSATVQPQRCGTISYPQKHTLISYPQRCGTISYPQRCGTISYPQRCGTISYPQRCGTISYPQRCGTISYPQSWGNPNPFCRPRKRGHRKPRYQPIEELVRPLPKPQPQPQPIECPRIEQPPKNEERKTQWPQCENQGCKQCRNLIQKETRGKINASIVPEGSIVTADFRTDRVRIFCDANDKVSGVPRVG